MTEQEMFKRWQEFCWMEGVYTHWVGFFTRMIGQPTARTEALCQLGTALARGEHPKGSNLRERFEQVIVATRQSANS